MPTVTDEIRNEVKETVYNFFADECEIDPSQISDESNLIKDLEGDSLMFLELLEIFKKKYSLDIDFKSVGKFVVKNPVETVGGVIDMTCLIIEHGNQIVDCKL